MVQMCVSFALGSDYYWINYLVLLQFYDYLRFTVMLVTICVSL